MSKIPQPRGCGFQENEISMNDTALANREIGIFNCFQENEHLLNSASVANREINIFNGFHDKETIDNSVSVANKEFKIFNGLQENEPFRNSTSVANTEIGIFNEFREYEKLAEKESNFQARFNSSQNDELAKFNRLYKSLEDKIKVLHHSIGDDSYNGVDNALVDINDILQLTDFVETYEKANDMIKETEDSISNFLKSTPSPQGSLLPSLKRSSHENSNSFEENEQESSEDFSYVEDDELKNTKREVKSLKNEVNALQNKVEELDQQIIEFSPQRKSVREPIRSRNVSSPRNTSSFSPRIMRNKLRTMQKRVEEGDVNTMYSLGACYALGDGVPQDKEKALYYYNLAAEKGSRNAQYAAAACYSYGKGTEVDKNKAFELFLSAAEKGHPKAQFAVGHFYEYGQGGVERDHEKAKEWYKKAANQGHFAAKKFLDECYSESSNFDDNE